MKEWNEVKMSQKGGFCRPLYGLSYLSHLLVLKSHSLSNTSHCTRDVSRPRNSNFDPTIKTDWNQYHCEDYQILSPTTIHGSKSELERPRYYENRANTSIDAPLTSGGHNFWSNHWIFKFHTFLKTGSQDLYRGVKINPIWDHLKVVVL